MRSLFAFRSDTSLSKSAGVLVLCALMLVTTVGCNQAQILQYLQEVAPTVIAVLNLVAAFGGPAMTQSKADTLNAEQANVIDLYKKWQSASAAAKPDAMSQFSAAYATFASNVEETLVTLRVVNPKYQAEVQAAVSAGLILLNQIQVLIPGNTPTGAQMKAAKAGQFYKSPSDYRSKFNAIVSGSGHPEFKI